MLQLIRNYSKGVIAWIIVVLLIIPFALWGVNEYFTDGTGDVVVAKVGDREIQSREFQSLYQRELAIRRQASQGNFDASDPAIRREVLDRLINTEAMTQAAAKAGFRISDERLAQQIRSMREFQTDGRFDPALYDRLLRVSGLSRATFEENLRRDLIMEQLIIGIAESAALTDYELDRWLRLSGQQRRFGYLVLEAADYMSLVEVGDEDISRYYRENINRFEVPERVKAEYVELSLGGFRDQIDVDESTLRRLYDERSGAFSVGEERHVRHILIAVDDGADAESVNQARERAADLRRRIDGGEAFADLAREYSDDSGSAGDGGDLGFISRGMMPSSFEDAMFALAEGGVSEPVQSPFGLHIIRVDRIRPGSTRSFEEMRGQLRDEYLSARADERYFELTEQLADLTFEHPDTLATAAEELDLVIHETEYFSRDQGQGIASERDFRQAAFSSDVFEAGNNSPLLSLGQDRVLVLRIQDRQPASHRSLEEISNQLARELREQGAARMAEEEGERIIERVAQGESLAKIAVERGLVWRSEVLATRDEASLPFDILGAVFTMKKPAGDRARIEGASQLSGDYAIIALQEVIDGVPEQISGDDRRLQRDNIARLLQARDTDDLLRSLKDRLDVRIFESRL